jgi:hypothetical protein
MILWIAIFCLIIGIVLIFVGVKTYEDSCMLVGIALTLLLGIVVSILGSAAIAANIAPEAELAKELNKRESLIYQLDNEIYDNDDDILGKRDLYKDIETFNSDLAYNKTAQKDFWIGIFYPNIYDKIDYIKYKEIKNAE